MAYFVTGATGFIGRFLLAELLDHREGPIYCLTRASSLDKLDALKARLGDDDRIVPVIGELGKPRLGVDDAEVDKLNGQIEHFFHLAAIYDLTADADTQHRANVDGTRHALQLAAAVHAEHFHQTRTIAAAGLSRGVFTEDMFDEAEDVEHNPYYATKHKTKHNKQQETKVPWRI